MSLRATPIELRTTPSHEKNPPQHHPPRLPVSICIHKVANH
jgi:hypothetical protein